LRAGFTEPAAYQAFEVDKERFGWMRDPSGRENVDGISEPLLGARSGPVWWFLRLVRRRTGWRVVKAVEWKSLEAARMAAGMEWAGRHGYFVGLRSGRAALGPNMADFEDPIKYIALLKKGGKLG
jgi:hypothetical protein